MSFIETNIDIKSNETLSSLTSEYSVSVPSDTPLSLQNVINETLSIPSSSSEFSVEASSATPPLLQKDRVFSRGGVEDAKVLTNEMNYQSLDFILEKEKNNNKNDSWNKIDKTEKIQKLHKFAEKYGKSHNLQLKDIKNLKVFFIECLEKMKLQKTKDVIYDKETKEISSIPALYYNMNSHNFTLKIMDNKRVSTIKSLTPKRSTSKNKEEEIGL